MNQDGFEVVAALAGGYTLYRKPNGAGGYTYISDEINGGVVVWDTCLVRRSTLITAMEIEERRLEKEKEDD